MAKNIGIEFGEPSGSFDVPPVVIPFSAIGETGLSGTVTYEGPAEQVYADAGLPLVTEQYDLTPPAGKRVHTWSVEVVAHSGDVVHRGGSNSILNPINGGTKEFLAQEALRVVSAEPGTFLE